MRHRDAAGNVDPHRNPRPAWSEQPEQPEPHRATEPNHHRHRVERRERPRCQPGFPDPVRGTDEHPYAERLPLAQPDGHADADGFDAYAGPLDTDGHAVVTYAYAVVTYTYAYADGSDAYADPLDADPLVTDA